MRRILCFILIALLAGFATPALALFTNGGFETGDFTGWDLDFGDRASNNTKNITWGQADHSRYEVINNAATMSGQTLDIDPYYGTYMARINDIYGGYHATKLSQSDNITQQDIDDGANLFVTWGAALIEPSNAHPTGAQPYFGINVFVGGVLEETFEADAIDANAAGWTNAGNNGGTLWYKKDTWTFDLASYAVGDEVLVEMFVSDCGWGGHGGYAFLDGIGTIKPPEVPEPATMVLLGLGLFGLAGLRRRMK